MIGLIAQEVEKVLPGVVYRDPVTGYLSVAYTVPTPYRKRKTRQLTQKTTCTQELVPVIIEALKEHLKEYATEKYHVQQELSSLRAALTKLQSAHETSEVDSDSGGDDDGGHDDEQQSTSDLPVLHGLRLDACFHPLTRRAGPSTTEAE